MKVIMRLLCVILVLAGFGAKAQDTLRINPNALDSLHATTFILNDSAAPGNYPSFGIWLYNPTGTQFSDSVEFGYSIRTAGVTTVYSSDSFNGSGINFPARPVSIPAHDSIVMFNMSFDFSSPDFVIGSSTVVIWPIAFHSSLTYVLDSASAQLVIQNNNDIKSIDAGELQVYMSGSFLTIKNESSNPFGEIRIFNTEGRLLIRQELDKQLQIPMAQYSPGIYIAEVTLADGSRFVQKVLNMPQE